MPDYGIAAQVQPPNVSSLSAILGIQQQRQALQIGAQQLVSSQAKATMDAQAARENQAAAQLLSDPVGNGVIDATGAPTPNAQSIIARTMPTTWTQHYGDIVNAAKTKVDFTTSVNNLNAAERGEIAGAYGRGAADPNNSKEDVKDLVQSVVDSKKGTPAYEDFQRIAAIGNQIIDHASNRAQGQEPQGNESWRRAALGLNGTLLPATAVTGPGGISLPVSDPNAAGVRQLVHPVTGTRTLPTLGPGATNPAAPQISYEQAVAQLAAGRQAQAQEGATRSPQIINALREARTIIEQNPNVLRGGMTPAMLQIRSTLAGVFGADMDTAADGNMLAKQLAVASLGRANQFGAGNTDAGRDLSIHASPNVAGDAKSLPKLINQAMGLEQYNIGVANAKAKVRSPQQQLDVETRLRSIPHGVEAFEAGNARTPAEADDILKRYNMSRAEMAAARKALRDAGAL